MTLHIPESLHIRIHGCDGSFWHVHGDGQGNEGVWIGKDQVKGLFSAPVRTEWKASARGVGGELKGQWYDWRDLLLGFHIAAGAIGGSQEDVQSRFRQAFNYREDPWDHDARLARIEVTTATSTRYLDVQLYEQPDFDPGIDPLLAGHGNPLLSLRAGQPFWYEDDVITTWSTSGTSGTGEIIVENPTDTVMHQKWILTRGTWILPDVSWEGAPHQRVRGVSKLTGRDDSERMIPMPPLGALQGGAVVELDPLADLMVRDAHDTNILGQMPIPGMYFEYSIPSWTPPTPLPLSVTDAPSGVGAMAQLVQPRRWTEAIGGQ